MAWGLFYPIHCSISTQVDPFAWGADKARVVGGPIRKYRKLRSFPFLGWGALPPTKWNTPFGERPDENHENDGDRELRSYALVGEDYTRLLDDPSIDDRILDCFLALPRTTPGWELVRIALTLRPGSAESVGWCSCITGFKFAQFLAIEFYCVKRAAVREALRCLDRRFGSTEVTTGEQGLASQALAWYAFNSRCEPVEALFLDRECTRSVADHRGEVARGVKIYEQLLDGSVCCYQCTSELWGERNGYMPTEMVVLPVPSWARNPDVGIACPFSAVECHLAERLEQFGLDRCSSCWPGEGCRNAFEGLRTRMGDEAYKPSTSFFIIVRHIISGQGGRRGVIIFNKDAVAFASVAGARDLYAFEYPLHLISNECFDRVRLAADGTLHWRYDGGGSGYQKVTYPLADWKTARGTAKGGLQHWLTSYHITPHLVMLRVALEENGARVPDGFPEVPSSVRAKLSENKAFAYCSFYDKYVKGKCCNLGIPFADMLRLGVTTPREVVERSSYNTAHDDPEWLAAV